MAAFPEAVPSLPQPSDTYGRTSLQIGEMLVDKRYVKWIVESFIGGGSGGMIYAVERHKDDTLKPMWSFLHDLCPNLKYVVKIGPYTDPLLAQEARFYHTVLGYTDFIANWIKFHNLKYFPLPYKLITRGTHVTPDRKKHLFLLMERYGENLDTLFCNSKGRKFSLKTICYIALRMIEALQYIHVNNYAHGDVKGANILTGYSPSEKHEVYLVDFGLSYRFMDNKGNYTCDARVLNTKVGIHRHCCYGTMLYCSIDTHCFGKMPSANGDLESLGYCLIEWAGGVLPWEQYSYGCCIECMSRNISTEKGMYVNKGTQLLKDSFGLNPVPSYLTPYLLAVQGISYHKKPDYNLLKAIFYKALQENGFKDDEIGLDWLEQN